MVSFDPCGQMQFILTLREFSNFFKHFSGSLNRVESNKSWVDIVRYIFFSKIVIYRWWFERFLIFTPIFGEMIQFIRWVGDPPQLGPGPRLGFLEFLPLKIDICPENRWLEDDSSPFKMFFFVRGMHLKLEPPPP